MSLGIVTPAGYLSGLLSQLMTLSRPKKISIILNDIVPKLKDLGRDDLAGRLTKVSLALTEGTYNTIDWQNSRVYDELTTIQEALQRGDPIEEAVNARQAAEELSDLTGPINHHPTSLIARPTRTSIGPPPRIAWQKFGTAEHPAPNPPDALVHSAGKRLSYLVDFVAGIAGHGALEMDTESFYGISGDIRRSIRKGEFVPLALGKFLVHEARKLIDTASSITPRYGQLMRELIIESIFEAHGWSLGLPNETTPWDASFLYALRRYVTARLLTEDGKRQVLADRALIRVVRNKVSLEKVNWHPGRTRREAFEPWLLATNNGNSARLNMQRRFIGNGLLRAVGWKQPEPYSPNTLKLQWMVRYWIAHYHYGALPARGLPFSTQDIIRYAMAGQPDELIPAFKQGLKEMMSDFYTAEELDTLTIKEAAV